MSVEMGDTDFLEMISNINPGPLGAGKCLPADEVDLDLLSWESGSTASHCSFDSDFTDDSLSSKRSKHEEKLQKNREAATRCRQKRKQEQLKAKDAMADLENQLQKVKSENMALQLENSCLRTEIRSLKESLAKLMKDNKASVTGVVAFGVVCMLPVFSSSSTASSSMQQASDFALNLLRGVLAAVGVAPVSAAGASAVRASASAAPASASAALLGVGGRGVLLLLAVLAAFVVISFLLGGPSAATCANPASVKLPSVSIQAANSKATPVGKGEQTLASTGSATLDAVRAQIQYWATHVMEYKEILPF